MKGIENLKRFSWIWPLIILISAVGTILVVFWDFAPGFRPVVVLWYLLICPGMAYVRLLNLRDLLAEWVLAVALSVSIDAIVSGVMLYAGFWYPLYALLFVISVSVLGVVLQVFSLNARVLPRPAYREIVYYKDIKLPSEKKVRNPFFFRGLMTFLFLWYSLILLYLLFYSHFPVATLFHALMTI